MIWDVVFRDSYADFEGNRPLLWFFTLLANAVFKVTGKRFLPRVFSAVYLRRNRGRGKGAS